LAFGKVTAKVEWQLFSGHGTDYRSQVQPNGGVLLSRGSAAGKRLVPAVTETETHLFGQQQHHQAPLWRFYGFGAMKRECKYLHM